MAAVKNSRSSRPNMVSMNVPSVFDSMKSSSMNWSVADFCEPAPGGNTCPSVWVCSRLLRNHCSPTTVRLVNRSESCHSPCRAKSIVYCQVLVLCDCRKPSR